jgi:hypothetical protein
MYDVLFGQMKKQLRQLDAWLTTASEHAKAKGFDGNVLLGVRLAPDQFPLVRQVQIACDTLKLGASRLSGKAAPSHADDEQSIDALHGRVKDTLAYLDGISSADLAGAAGRSITQPRWEGKTMSGADYFVEHVVPNFYFHLSHVYALLRHNGVPLGKKDYLGTLTMRAP